MIGAIATMGVIVGSEVPMFLGALIIAPISAWLLKKLDKAIEGKTPSGFEMLVDNFSLGILGMIMAILGRLGILWAFMLFGPKLLRASAPGAIIIDFLGGIHETYFPYILAKPTLILAAIGGGMTGIFNAGLLNSGLVSTASPGSIIAYMAVTPRGGHVGVLVSVLAAAVVSFVIASLLLGFSRKGDDETEDAAAAAATPAETALETADGATATAPCRHGHPIHQGQRSPPAGGGLRCWHGFVRDGFGPHGGRTG